MTVSLLGLELRSEALCFCVALLLVLLPQAVAAQGCGISVTVQPATVNFPGNALPSSQGLTFAEIIDVNYTAANENQTLALQYLNGTQWVGLENFTGNPVGFTEVDYGINSAWAKFGDNAVRVVGSSCTSGVATVTVKADPDAVALDVATYAAVGVLVLLFVVLGKRLGWKRFAILAAAVYLALSPFTGQRYDIYFLLSSGIRILQHVNPFNPGSPPVYPGALKWAYPPLYALYSALSFLAYQLLTGTPLPSVSALTYPGWLTATYSVFQAFVPAGLPILVFLLKIPMIVSALLTGLLLSKMTGKELPAILWVANPLIVLVAAIWGQLDPIATLLAVAALYYFRKRKMYPAYFFASVGAAVKIWPALMIPFMLVMSLRRDGRMALKPLSAVVPAALATAGLYAAYGNFVDTIGVFVYARGIPTFAGAFSVNGLTWQEILFVLKSPPVPLFLFVGIPAYILALAWVYRKRDEDLAKWTILSVLVLFLTYNYVNPQYFYWVVPFLILQARKTWTLVFTALPLIYMVFAYDIFYFVSPSILANEFSLGASIADQMKVSFFYQNSLLFVLVTGVIPTIAYLALAYSELRPSGWRGSGFVTGAAQNEEGLIAEPVEGKGA